MENMAVIGKFWKNKRVFVTGHTGFKGGWLCCWLKHLGARLSGYALEPKDKPNLFNILKIDEICDSTIGDIRDERKLTGVLKKQKPDIVFHLAAQPLVRQSYKDPLETYQTNVIGTANLLWAAMAVKSIKAIVCVTTDKCYENMEWQRGYVESDKLGGFDPYSSSKACAEIITAAFSKSFFQPGRCKIATARAGNVLGGGDWAADRLVPDSIKAWMKNKTVEIRYPKAVRPWQHVLEPLSGYIMLAEKLCSAAGSKFAQPWNFGPADKDMITVEKLLAVLGENWGPDGKWKVAAKKQPHESGLLKLNCTKARTLLNWRPRWNIKKAVEKTVEWYKHYYTKSGDLTKLTVCQIEEYMKDLKR